MTDRRFKPPNTTGPRQRYMLKLDCGHITTTITFSGRAPKTFKCPCNTNGKRRWDHSRVVRVRKV